MVWANPGRDQTRQIAISDMLGEDTADNTQATTLVAANRDGSIVERLEHLAVTLVDDAAANFIGVDDADNVAATTNVVANRDGSVLERLEALMDPTAEFNPYLGFGVTKVSNLADGTGTDNLFTINGRCLITHLTGEVTTVLATSTTMKLTINSIDICAATTITDDAVGTMYSLPGLSAQILNGTGDTPVIGVILNWTTPASRAGIIAGGSQAAYTLAHVLNAAGTGAVTWRLYYWPLVSGATIAAAA